MKPFATGLTRASTFGPLTVLVAVIAMSTASPAAAPPKPGSPPGPELARLKAHVETLASQEFGGRQGEGARKAADYVERHLREFGLKPLFGDRYHEPIISRTLNREIGRNVGGKIEAADPKLNQEWVIVSAHFDHLGEREGRLYPGADDNASGVAMILETARLLAANPEQCRRNVMIVGFDLEEPGLWGSRDFVDHPPVPLSQIRLFVTADMLSRALGGVCRSHLFVTGTERIPEARSWLEEAAKGRPLTLGVIGTDIVGTRSDYGPFRASRIPFLFFSTGESPAYHTVDDIAETIDAEKLKHASGLILDVVRRALREPALPEWRKTPDNPLSEAIAIRDVLEILLKHQDRLQLNALQKNLIVNQVLRLNEIAKRGAITPAERSAMVRIAQLVMATAL